MVLPFGVTNLGWACVKDNVTGLIWEVKTDNTPSDLHDKDDRYTWYNTDSTANGGANGVENPDSTTYCNTEAYVNRVNTASLCGAKDWRMPTVKELEGLVDFGRSSSPAIDTKAIDTNYFPNDVGSDVWSGSPFANPSGSAWYVSFNYGGSYANYRNYNLAVRLVRGGQ